MSERRVNESQHSTGDVGIMTTLLKLIGFKQTKPTTIFCDNEGTISLTKDLSFHARTKHINIQHHFVWECMESRDVIFLHLPTREMPADALTKPLAQPQFQYLIKKLGVLDPDDLTT
jgi:hypothetical protein